MSLTPSSIEVLMGLTKLTYLAIQQGQLLDGESVALIGEMKSLKALALNKIHFAHTVHPLTRLPNLQLLSLKSTTVTDNDLVSTSTSTMDEMSALMSFIELGRCESLIELDISHCHRITIAGVMRYQELIECRHFDDHGSPSHCCYAAPLKVLRTHDCKGLRASGCPQAESRPIRGPLGEICWWETRDSSI